MSAILLDGKACAAKIEKRIAGEIERLGMTPRLLIITQGEDPASKVYVRNKLKAAERCGIDAFVRKLPLEFNSDQLRAFFSDWYYACDGMILQLPLRNRGQEENALKTLPYYKDVDGLTTGSKFTPCTPKGIMRLLSEYGIAVSGKHVVVVGRSRLVGKPLSKLMLDADATVTVCHSKTEDLAFYSKQADILVSAVGKEKLITAEMVKPGAVVIDVGINKDEKGKLCGDVDFEEVKEIAGWITPVPGGVGPMTVAMLMENTLEAV